jgi:YfiH family protein
VIAPPAADAYLVPDWPAPGGVRAAVTTRRMPGNSRPPFDAFNLGLRCGEDPGIVAANRALLVRAFGLPSAPCWLRQVHGREVVEFEAAPPDAHAGANADAEPAADAACTRTAGVVLAILAADCLPVLFCTDDGSGIAVAHAGWRGLAAGVLEAALDCLDVPAGRVLAWLGPCIGAATYEIDDAVRDAFVDRDPRTMHAFTPNRPGHWQCSLEDLARRALARAGVRRVFGGGFDTFTDARFYSYRRDGERSGRFASLIWRDA